MKKDIEALALAYKNNPTPEAMEDVLTAMEPLIRYWCQTQCYLAWEREDLMQVARIAVVGALERFEPDKEIRFKTFAYRTVSGKIMNYYRDSTWRVVIPRKYREISTRITRAENEYMQIHGEAPTTDQLADILQMDKAELKEAMEAKMASTTTSFSAHAEDEEGYAPELYVGKVDQNLDSIELKKDLKMAMEGLNEQQKQIIYYRYFEDMTQSKVAALLGVSQMQVSRLEKAALQKIKDKMHVL
ncbi:MAG: sigma-70 family RNA polymerase sigma factor [Peptococcaceae bacterium]|nr:sigma-70 family RNA polymerase sigma factor [Peptococcaceae bacterium]